MVFIGDGFSRRKLFNGSVNNLTTPTCFLFDNGSYRPDSTLALRRVAARLAAKTGLPVRAHSLLHSDRVEPAELGGEPAQLLEPALADFAREGGHCAILLPLFFGPSGAMRDYLPPRLRELQIRHPECPLHLAACLESEVDDSAAVIATALDRAVTVAAEENGFRHPAVIVTDHGSPLPAVTAVRNRVGAALAAMRQSHEGRVAVASMERRDGEAYAFNEPLLASALRDLASAGEQEVVVALQFIFPGRHAGAGGDIASICTEFVQAFPGVSVAVTLPLGESDEILQLLARRLEEAVSSLSWTQSNRCPTRNA